MFALSLGVFSGAAAASGPSSAASSGIAAAATARSRTQRAGQTIGPLFYPDERPDACPGSASGSIVQRRIRAGPERVGHVKTYLVELFVSRGAGDGLEARVQRARRAADDLRQAGLPIHYRRSIFVPDEETWFLLYEADLIDLVREAVVRAGLSPERVSEAVADSIA
jgi:hypothetical protein